MPTTSTSAARTTSRSSSTVDSSGPPGTFRTAIDRRVNGGVIVNVFYKHSRIKQYLKDGRAMRCHAAPGSAEPIAATR